MSEQLNLIYLPELSMSFSSLKKHLSELYNIQIQKEMSDSKKVQKLYDKANYLFNNYIANNGTLNYSDKEYGYLGDELEDVAVGYFKDESVNGDYAETLRNEGFTMIEQDAINVLEHRIESIEEEVGPVQFEEGGGVDVVKIGDKVTLPEIKMPDGRVQYEKIENGEVIYIENGIYGVMNPKTKRIHQVLLEQMEYAKGGGVGKSIDEYVDEFSDLSGLDKDSSYIIKIKSILNGISNMLSGIKGMDSTGGNHYHLFFQLKDETWIGFHSATGDITISEKFKTFRGIQGNPNWDKVTNRVLASGSNLEVDENSIINDIKNKNYERLYATGGGVGKRSLMSMANLVVADWIKESIRDWYTKNYPTDDLGKKINEITFEDLWNATNVDNIYGVIGVGDSLIRERLFEHLSEIYGVSYNDVYDRLFGSDKFAEGGGVGEYYVMDAKSGEIVSKGFDTEENAKVEMYRIFEETGNSFLLTKMMANGGGIKDKTGGVIGFEFYHKDLGQMTWNKAKEACADLGDGWRLPTKDELNLIYINKDVVGGFASSSYWSSTESGNNHAWGQDFGNGSQYGFYKNDTGYVRAVRGVHKKVKLVDGGGVRKRTLYAIMYGKYAQMDNPQYVEVSSKNMDEAMEKFKAMGVDAMPSAIEFSNRPPYYYANGGGIEKFASGAKFTNSVNHLKDFIRQYPYIWTKNGKEYVPIEGWQYAALLMGYSARVTSVEQMGAGYMAKADVVDSRGNVVCSGFGYVDSNEAKWANKPVYQLIGFAQTRAVSRALRNCLSWMVKAAGYSTTPAEEMYGITPEKRGGGMKSKPVMPPAAPQEPNFIFDEPKYKAPMAPPAPVMPEDMGGLDAQKIEETLREMNAKAKANNIEIVSPEFMNRIKDALLETDTDLHMSMLKQAIDYMDQNNIVLQTPRYMLKLRKIASQKPF